MQLEIPLISVDMTGLDRALAAAEQDGERSAEFYNLFLNTEIFIPLIEKPDIAEPSVIKPLLMEAEGRRRLMLFDTEERLYAWAGGDGMEYAAMQGYELVEMMDAAIPWVLNAGTEYPKEFDCEEIQWMKESMEEAGDLTEANA